MTPQAYAIPGFFKLDEALEGINELFYVTPSEIKSKSRKRDIITARSVMYNYLRNEANPTIETYKKKRTLSKVGAMVSGLDHSCVFNGLKNYNNLFETDKEYRDKFNEFKRMMS